jgi:hypothetical protein
MIRRAEKRSQRFVNTFAEAGWVVTVGMPKMPV